jgi:hypothetical protein
MDERKEEDMRRLTRVGIIGLVAGALVGTAVPAFAGGDQEVVNRGRCSMGSEWKVRIRTDGPNLLDLNFEVDSNVPGQTWRAAMAYNGDVVFNGFATTNQVDGEFDIDVEVANQAGADTLQAAARLRSTGETCRASVTANF